MTKYVTWLHHPDFLTGDGKFSPAEIKNIEKTAWMLKCFFDNKKGIIAHFPAGHAERAASIISEKSGICKIPETYDILWRDHFPSVSRNLFPKLNNIDAGTDFAVLLSTGSHIKEVVFESRIRRSETKIGPLAGIILAFENWADVTENKMYGKSVYANITGDGIRPVF